MATFVNFNDERIPIGKRKQAFVKWAVKKGTSEIEAKRIANKKFGFEKKGKVAILVDDYGRVQQNSFHYTELYEHLYRMTGKRRERWEDVWLFSLCPYCRQCEDEDLIKSLIDRGYKIVKVSLYP